jgi:hypothetical protein
MQRTTHGQSRTPEYKVWASMWQRCTNPKNVRYGRYGGRGIGICERWEKFENFFADMGLRPSNGHSIDRKDNEGNYEPSNCHWATRSEQQNNKSGYRADHSLPRGGAHWTRQDIAKAQDVARANIVKAHKNGSENGNSRLTEDSVKVIKPLIGAGRSDTSIALDFGVRPGTIWFIRTGKHWNHVQ